MCVCVCLYMFIICLFMCVYICICLVRHENRQYVSFHGFRRRPHPTLLYGFRRRLFYGFRRRRKRLLMVSVAGLFVDSSAAGGSKILECIERFLCFCVFRTGFRRWFLYGFRRGRKAFFNGFRRCFC